MPFSNNPKGTRLVDHSDRELLVMILCEMRVQTMIIAQEYNVKDDLGDLRNEVMMQGGNTVTDV